MTRCPWVTRPIGHEAPGSRGPAQYVLPPLAMLRSPKAPRKHHGRSMEERPEHGGTAGAWRNGRSMEEPELERT